MTDTRSLTARARADLAAALRRIRAFPNEQAYEFLAAINVFREIAAPDIGPALRAAQAAFSIAMDARRHDATAVDHVKHVNHLFGNLAEAVAGTPLADALNTARKAFIAAVQGD